MLLILFPTLTFLKPTFLGWVYTSLIEGEETADEAKARVEADRASKVQKQIDAAATTASGVPW